MKLAAMLQGIVTLPRRTWWIVSALGLSCAAGAALYAAWAAEPAPSLPATAPAQLAIQATVEATAVAAPAVAAEVRATAEPAGHEPRQFLPQTREESVIFDVSSQGCFGGREPERFEIRGEDPGVVRVIDPGNGAVTRTMALDEATRAELARTIAFYRSPPGDVVCSTVELVQVSFRQGDKTVWSETYEDSTCETDYRGAPWSLAELFDAKRQAGKDERMSRDPLSD